MLTNQSNFFAENNNYRSSRVSRTSRLADRNANNHIITDSLYEPLRQTLQKVSLSPHSPVSTLNNFNQFSSRSLHKQPTNRFQSRVSNFMRDLSPQEADYLKRNTFIPIDKKLVPTKHLSKVFGKKFEAVSVQQRQLAPITQEQMKLVLSKPIIHQNTVYEFVDDVNGYGYRQAPQQGYHWQSKNSIENGEQDAYQIRYKLGKNVELNHRIHQHYSAGQRNSQNSIRIQDHQQTPQSNFKAKVNQYISQNFSRNFNGDLESNYFSPRVVKQQFLNDNPRVSQPQSPNRIISNAIYKNPPLNFTHNNDYLPTYSFHPKNFQLQTQPYSPMNANLLTKYENYDNNYRVNPNVNIHPPIVSSPSQTNILQNSGHSQRNTKMSRPNSHLSSTSSANKYNFKQNIDRSKKGISSKSNKSLYKYNLYSVLDATMNTGCKKGCGDNQIIAKRLKTNQL